MVGGRAALGEALDSALASLTHLFAALDTSRQGVLVPAKVRAVLACKGSTACEAMCVACPQGQTATVSCA